MTHKNILECSFPPPLNIWYVGTEGVPTRSELHFLIHKMRGLNSGGSGGTTEPESQLTRVWGPRAWEDRWVCWCCSLSSLSRVFPFVLFKSYLSSTSLSQACSHLLRTQRRLRQTEALPGAGWEKVYGAKWRKPLASRALLPSKSKISLRRKWVTMT